MRLPRPARLTLALCLLPLSCGSEVDAERRIGELLEQLRTADYAGQAEANRELSEFGARAVPAYLELLREKDFNLHALAASALGDLGQEAEAAIPALVEVLRRGFFHPRDEAAAADPSLPRPSTTDRLRTVDPGRKGAAQTLARIGAAAVPPVVALLGDENAQVRLVAAVTLGELKLKARTAVASLRARLQDEVAAVVCQAAWALGEIGEVDEAVIPELVSLLKDTGKQDEVVRLEVVRALGRLGPKARTAVPDLHTLAHEGRGSELRRAASSAMQAIQAIQAEGTAK